MTPHRTIAARLTLIAAALLLAVLAAGQRAEAQGTPLQITVAGGLLPARSSAALPRPGDAM